MNNMLNTNKRQTAQEVFLEMQNSLWSKKELEDPRNKPFQSLCKHVYDLGCQFLDAKRIMSAGTNVYQQDQVISLESFNPEANMALVGEEDLRNLVMSAGVPQDLQHEAMDAVQVLLAKMKACGSNNELYRNQHFGHGDRTGINQTSLKTSTTTVFAPALHEMASNIGLPSQEAFGASIDKVLPDIRASLAVTLLQFHRGLIDRIMHRRTSASPYVKYVVPYSEVYDMLLSNDASHKVRNEGDHIIPFIELYGDPRSVSNILQPIVPLRDNDTEGQLLADGIVKFNTKCNLFDLSVLPGQLGRTHYNYTDLVSENVVLDSVIVKLSKGTTEELFQINMRQLNGSRLQMQPNTVDSGIRAAIIEYTHKLDKNSKTMTGADSVLLANCTETDFLRLKMKLAITISLKYSDVDGLGTVLVEAYNRDNAEPAAAVKTLLNGMTVELAGYSVDARYSEENLRKSNLAIRYHVRTFDFEISNGRNILVDYSFEEELPEFLMSLVTEATSLGQDHRGIDIIIKELMYVFDVTNLENQDPDFRDRLDKVGFQYISGQLVRPVVYLNTIDLDNVDTIRTSDMLGDIRQYVEWEMLNLCSLIYQNSFYKHQLKPGEKPMFKCVTSSVILENIFSIPHIHNHLNTNEPVDGSTVEYRRVLPNGTVLDFVSSTYQYLRDKVLCIPFRENMPDDILNFGHNWDFGTFIAHYNPQLDNAVNKRVFSNSRTMVIPTLPLGIYLDVKHISKLVNLFQISSPTDSRLPQPSEVVAAQS